MPSAPFCCNVAASAKKNAATRATISATTRSLRRVPDARNVVEPHDLVDEIETFRTMRDQEDRATIGRFEHVADERLGGRFVEVRGRLVEEEHRSVREQRSCDDEALALTAGELRSLLADERVEPVRQRFDPVVETRPAQSVDEFARRSLRAERA